MATRTPLRVTRNRIEDRNDRIAAAVRPLFPERTGACVRKPPLMEGVTLARSHALSARTRDVHGDGAVERRVLDDQRKRPQRGTTQVSVWCAVEGWWGGGAVTWWGGRMMARTHCPRLDHLLSSFRD